MIFDFALEFMMELLRALLIEELGRRVRERGMKLAERRRHQKLARRVLHKLTTERQKKE